MRLLVLIIISLISFNNLIAQNLKWVKDFGGNNLVTVRAIESDNNGNIYTIGEFEGPIDFDPSNANFTLTPKNNLYKDIYIQKLDSNGNFLWAKSIGELNTNYCSNIITSNDGSFYISGHFRDSLDFDPSSNVNMLYAQARDDGYIAKYDTTGNLIWAKGFHGAVNTRVLHLQIDNSNNLIASGSFDNQFSFGAFNSADSVGNGNRTDVFVCKIDPNGNWIWGQGIGGTFFISNSSLVVDKNDNILLGGSFQATADFDPSSSVLQITSKGSYDVYILNLNSSGNLNWIKTLGTTGSSDNTDIQINDSSIYVTGYFADTLDMDPGASNYPLFSTGNFDSYILKLDMQGNFIWAKSVYGVNGSYANRLAFNRANEVLIAGEFFGTCDFDPDSSSALNITSNGDQDLYFLKLSKNGDFISAATIGGPNYEYLEDMAQTTSNEYVFTGSYLSNMTDFDPQTGVTNVLTNGQFNFYTLKLIDTTSVVGIFNRSEIDEIKYAAYPNPAKEFIQIENPFSEAVTLSILNSNAQLVLSDYKLNSGQNQIPIDFPKGVYYIQLKSSSGSEVIKLIKD